jgi:hypothetical protein
MSEANTLAVMNALLYTCVDMGDTRVEERLREMPALVKGAVKRVGMSDFDA